MRQSRLMSLVEAVADVAVGYGVAVVTQVVIFPLFWLSGILRSPNPDNPGGSVAGYAGAVLKFSAPGRPSPACH